MPVGGVLDPKVNRPTLLVGSFPYKSARETLRRSTSLSQLVNPRTPISARQWAL